ncbi:hypothetical protein WA026_002577 [Henosepilachna vigintioctopunctata]|uniref:Ell-associated factor Eaf n=1 Tax=Henosepilachna vigintioctopunctata TaxID=420089 RepID=A0AAW1U0S0_9CUCU
MAEKLGLTIGNEVRELKIGQSFTNPKSTAFHTIKYDFKPASVDKNKIATVDVGNNHQVTVTVPHLDGAGVPQTVFKGSQRPYQKECVLIIDKITGEITLEKLSCNIQVKKTRSEFTKVPLPPDRLSQGSDRNSLASRSLTPPVGHRVSNKTKVTSGSRRPDRPITNLVPKHSPLHASPSYPSPNHHNKSPKNDLRNTNHDTHPSAAASLPMIGMDDFTEPRPPPINSLQNCSHQPNNSSHHPNNSSHHSTPASHTNSSAPTVEKPSIFQITPDEIGEITDSSSSSSDGDSDSDANSTAIEKNLTSGSRINGHSNGSQKSAPPKFNSVPSHLLNEDLCLSESGSDSD